MADFYCTSDMGVLGEVGGGGEGGSIGKWLGVGEGWRRNRMKDEFEMVITCVRRNKSNSLSK